MRTPLYRLNDKSDVRFFMKAPPASPSSLISLAPAGGGFSFSLSQEDFDRDFREATAAELAEYEAAKYSLVAIDDGPHYACLMSDQRWNGWAIPYFPHDSAIKILQELLETDIKHGGHVIQIEREGQRLSFVDAGSTLASGDRIFLWCPENSQDPENDADADIIEPAIVAGEETWGIGAGSWVWSEVEPEPTIDDSPSP